MDKNLLPKRRGVLDPAFGYRQSNINKKGGFMLRRAAPKKKAKAAPKPKAKAKPKKKKNKKK
jgi:hypothetical protein